MSPYGQYLTSATTPPSSFSSFVALPTLSERT
jgi:hypothetical protein